MIAKTDKTNPPRQIVKLTRAIAYEDGYGNRAAVAYDSTYRLGNEPFRYVKIEGVGGDIHVRVTDLQFVIDALNGVVEIDEQAHA